MTIKSEFVRLWLKPRSNHHPKRNKNISTNLNAKSSFLSMSSLNSGVSIVSFNGTKTEMTTSPSVSLTLGTIIALEGYTVLEGDGSRDLVEVDKSGKNREDSAALELL